MARGDLAGAADLELVSGVVQLRPQDAMVEAMLRGWRARLQNHTDGMMAPGRTSIGSETVPTYRPGQVRTLRTGSVLLIHRALRPISATTIDVSQRPDWPQLRRDIQTIRSGGLFVGIDGTVGGAAAPRTPGSRWRPLRRAIGRRAGSPGSS
jgi:hypothetical protein